MSTPTDTTNNDTDTNPQDPTSITSYPSEPNLYALLSLPRTPPPTDTQIRSAYRSLSRSFHPDKQPLHLRDAARTHFQRISDAYDILVDPRKRAVYDTVGLEGVREMWAQGSALSRERERMEMEGRGAVGVRAKTPEEFRRWFLGVMKRRERGVVRGLVGVRGHLSLGVDASDLLTVDEEAEEVYLNVPSPELSSFNIGYTFKAPFPTVDVLLGRDDEDDEDGNKDEGGEGEQLEMDISAGIAGQLRPMVMQGNEDVVLPKSLISTNMTLGAGVSRAFGDVSSMKGIFGRRPFSFLADSQVAVNAHVLPLPALQSTVTKAFAPIPGTKPFTVQLTSLCTHSVLKCPPVLALYVGKPIGDRKVVYSNWSSGTLHWPQLLERLLSPIVHLGSSGEIAPQISQFQLGFMSQPRRSIRLAMLDDDDEDEAEEEPEVELARSQHREESKAAETWQFVATATPESGSLSITYARNIFSGTAANTPRLSEWSSEGHYPLPPQHEPRSVRLEVQTAFSFGMYPAWGIEGTRQVGEFTRMGLGVGVEHTGLVTTISWSRLGQRIKIPITICAMDAPSADAAALAVIVPWAAYCAVEFGFVRPRERRRRRRAVARKQRQLMKLVPVKRAESRQVIQMIADQVQRRQEREERDGGLVIVRAEYGHYPTKRKEGAEEQVAGVTVPVAALVDRGQLVISKDMTKFHILGFYDPAPLLPKKLRVWYRYQGKEHYVEAGEGEGIACPMRAHLVRS